jgi:hypothetical protein
MGKELRQEILFYTAKLSSLPATFQNHGFPREIAQVAHTFRKSFDA